MITKKQIQVAERLRIAIMAGLDSPDTAIFWADEIIQRQTEPDYWFIEISMSKKSGSKELVSILGRHVEKTDHVEALICCLGRAAVLARQEKINLREFAKWLYQNEDAWDLPDELSFVGLVDDHYSLAEDKVFGTIEEVHKEFLDELEKRHSEQSAAPDWYSASLHTIR